MDFIDCELKTNKNAVLDIVIELVNGVKNGGSLVAHNGTHRNELHTCKYLLNQVLRQYNIPQKNYFISVKAKQLWDQLTDKDINNYFYREKIKCNNNQPVIVKSYIGTSNKFIEKTLKAGDSFIYKDIFHNEHIIPIEVVIKKLLALENLCYNKVEEILDNIYVCRILKEEDRKIKQKHKRPDDLDHIIKNIYGNVDIELVK